MSRAVNENCCVALVDAVGVAAANTGATGTEPTVSVTGTVIVNDPSVDNSRICPVYVPAARFGLAVIDTVVSCGVPQDPLEKHPLPIEAESHEPPLPVVACV